MCPSTGEGMSKWVYAYDGIPNSDKKEAITETSLVAQWLGICLTIQGM